MVTHVYARCGADGIKAVYLCSDRSGWMLAPGLCSLMETNIDTHCSFCHQLIYLSFDPGMKMGHRRKPTQTGRGGEECIWDLQWIETLQTGLGPEVCETFDCKANCFTCTDPDGGVL